MVKILNNFFLLSVFITNIFLNIMYADPGECCEEHPDLSSVYGWLYAGFGAAGNKYNIGIAGVIGLSYVKDNIIKTARFIYTEEFPEYYPLPELPETSRGLRDSFQYIDAGLLYGYVFTDRFIRISVSAGVSFLHGSIVKKDGQRRLMTLGIPLEYNLFISPLPLLGISFTGYANMNYVLPFQGYMMCIQIGRLR